MLESILKIPSYILHSLKEVTNIKLILMLFLLMFVFFRISAQKQKVRPVSYNNLVSHDTLSYLVGNYQYSAPNGSVTNFRGKGMDDIDSTTKKHFILLNSAESLIGGTELTGRYIGCEYKSDTSIIYYTAWMENLKLFKDTIINFELKNFRLSEKPIDLNQINFTNEEDERVRKKYANKSEMLMFELGFSFRGSYKNNKLNLQKVTLVFDSNVENMIFYKMKPKTTHECELPLRK